MCVDHVTASSAEPWLPTIISRIESPFCHGVFGSCVFYPCWSSQVDKGYSSFQCMNVVLAPYTVPVYSWFLWIRQCAFPVYCPHILPIHLSVTTALVPVYCPHILPLNVMSLFPYTVPVYFQLKWYQWLQMRIGDPLGGGASTKSLWVSNSNSTISSLTEDELANPVVRIAELDFCQCQPSHSKASTTRESNIRAHNFIGIT